MKSLYPSRKEIEREGTGLEIKVIQAPSVEPVSLAEAKSYCRIDGSEDDATISNLIIACRKEAERVTNHAFITQHLLAQWEEMREYVILPRPPHQSVISVESFDGHSWHALTTSGYRLSGLLRFRLDVWGQFSTLTRFECPFRVEFVCGEGDDDEHIDERIKPAILDMVLVAFDNRGQFKTSDGAEISGLMTPTAEAMLAGLTSYR